MASSPITTLKLLGPESREEVLVEIRVGKMNIEGSTVKPDHRKGMLYLLKGEGFFRIIWKERNLDSVEDDIIVLPKEANFDKVKQSKDRVYILKFKEDDRKYFFWMQEPNEQNDGPISHLLDYYLNHSLADDDETGDDQTFTFDAPPTTLEVSSSSGVHVEDHYMMPTTKGSNVPNNSALQGVVQLEDLQRILGSISPSEVPGGALLPQDTGPSLADILKPELVVPLLDNCHLEERLAPLLPEGTWTHESIIELMQSPQFHQQIDAFTHVLRTGQIDLRQFGIDPSKLHHLYRMNMATLLALRHALQFHLCGKYTLLFVLAIAVHLSFDTCKFPETWA